MVKSSAFAVAVAGAGAAVFGGLASASPVQTSTSTSSAASSSPTSFSLRANLSRGGPWSFQNTHIVPEHTGAGANALVASNETSSTPAYTIHDGYLVGSPFTESYPYAFGLPAYSRPGAPADDLQTTFNVSLATATRGFSVVPFSRQIALAGPDAGGFATFVLCNVSTLPPYAFSPQLQLLWSREEQFASEESQCADVDLFAV